MEHSSSCSSSSPSTSISDSSPGFVKLKDSSNPLSLHFWSVHCFIIFIFIFWFMRLFCITFPVLVTFLDTVNSLTIIFINNMIVSHGEFFGWYYYSHLSLHKVHKAYGDVIVPDNFIICDCDCICIVHFLQWHLRISHFLVWHVSVDTEPHIIVVYCMSLHQIFYQNTACVRFLSEHCLQYMHYSTTAHTTTTTNTASSTCTIALQRVLLLCITSMTSENEYITFSNILSLYGILPFYSEIGRIKNPTK